jgi:hypothetical protein
MPRERPATRDPLHQCRTLTPVEAAEGEHRNVRLAGPWRLKLGPECNQQQHRQTCYPIDHTIEELA